MAKVQYGIPQGLTAQGLSHEQIAQLMLQMQMQRGQDPSQTPGYDSLGDYGQQPNHPVYSVGQGLADVAGQLGSAYFRKKRDQQLMQGMAENNANLNMAAGLARDTNLSPLSRDVMNGNPMTAQPAFPNGAPQVPGAGGPPSGPMPQAQSAFPQGYSDPMNATQRGNYALDRLSAANPNGSLALQYGDQIRQAAQAAQPPPMQTVVGKPGDQIFGKDQTTGQVSAKPMASVPMTPPDILRPGVLAAEEAKTQAGKTSWHTMNADEKKAAGIPIASQAQVSSEGEIRNMPKEPGQIGPVYDSNGGQPLGVKDYTDADTAAKLASGEWLPHEPKVLAGADAQDLAKVGNTLSQLQAQASTFKPEYARIIGSDSKLRGFLGGKAFNEASEWFNKTQGILLPTVKDIAGRSPQLIDEFNKNRPEPTDAADVTQRKMDNLISLYKDSASSLANTYRRGGYNGNQIKQAIGFDPGVGGAAAPAANAPDPLGIRGK